MTRPAPSSSRAQRSSPKPWTRALAVHALYLSEGHTDDDLTAAVAGGGGAVWRLDPRVLASVASTETPQPVLATVGFVDVELAPSLDAASSTVRDPATVPLVVVAAGIGEPGNLGTIVRSALGAGATAVISCDGAVDLYNPKAVRAAAGALFRVPVVRDAEIGDVVEALASRSIRSFGLDAGAAHSIDDVDLTVPVAVVVGSEAHGLSPLLRSRLDDMVAIPLCGGLESLNAASALTVTCFEAARQRQSAETLQGPDRRGPTTEPRLGRRRPLRSRRRPGPGSGTIRTAGRWVPTTLAGVNRAHSIMTAPSDLRRAGLRRDVGRRRCEDLADSGVLQSGLLGKKAAIVGAKKQLGSLPPDERADAGQAINDAREAIEAAIVAARGRTRTRPSERARLEAERLDLTERLDRHRRGHLHLVTQARDRLEDVFVGMGFTVAEGPEVETAWYNFEALNIPEWHPARGELRHHLRRPRRTRRGDAALAHLAGADPHHGGHQSRRSTSSPPGAPSAPTPPMPPTCRRSTRSRVWSSTGASPSATSRARSTSSSAPSSAPRSRPACDRRTSRSPNRRPSSTSPVPTAPGSSSAAAAWSIPNVLRNCGIDPEEWQGFAFGFGIDRLAVMRYQLDDIRELVNNDVRFLRQF